MKAVQRKVRRVVRLPRVFSLSDVEVGPARTMKLRHEAGAGIHYVPCGGGYRLLRRSGDQARHTYSD
ncbi:MAG: hypothetical protein U0796_04480 [Gemmatales bacterium]